MKMGKKLLWSACKLLVTNLVTKCICLTKTASYGYKYYD